MALGVGTPVENQSSPGSSVSVNITVSAGSLVVAAVMVAATTTYAITDANVTLAGSAGTLAEKISGSGDGDGKVTVGIFYWENVTSGTKSISYSHGSSEFLWIGGVEVTGAATSSSQDTPADKSATGGTGDADTGTSAATAQANEIVFAAMSDYASDNNAISLNNTGTTGTYTLLGEEEDGANHARANWGYRITSATGTQRHVWSSNRQEWVAVLAAFKEAAASGQPPRTMQQSRLRRA